MNIFKTIAALFMLVLLASCASIPKPALVYNQGSVVDSMSTGVSLSLHASDLSMSGNGFMAYRRPDKIHMILL